MQTYRLFYMGAHNHIVGSFEFLADTDAETLAVAEARRDDRPAELWCGIRPVTTFAPRQGGDVPGEERT
jgi:hypothetical protein